MNEEIFKIVQGLQAQIDELKKAPRLTDHFHNGLDSSRVYFTDVNQRKVQFCHTIYGADAATAGNYGVFWENRIAPCYLSALWEVHQTAGSDAGAVTVTLEKLTGTQAPDAGVAMLSTALSLKTTANDDQQGTLTATLTDRNLALGDRLCLKDAGVLTAVANVTVFVELTIT